MLYTTHKSKSRDLTARAHYINIIKMTAGKTQDIEEGRGTPEKDFNHKFS